HFGETMIRPIVIGVPFLVILMWACLGAGSRAAPTSDPVYADTYAFINEFRIAHYLEIAAELQKLPLDKRGARLHEIALDPQRGSEVFPLCRMLFKAKDNGKFRRPLIGAAQFVGRGTYADWPLEPITLQDGMPVLIVTGYSLAGEAEPPSWYVDY